MSVASRRVRNKRGPDGLLTGRAGFVYDVSFRYSTVRGYRSYGKRGFLTRKQAAEHELEMRKKLSAQDGRGALARNRRLLVRDYLDEWLSVHGKANLRPSSVFSYRGYIGRYLDPYLGGVELRGLTAPMIDAALGRMEDGGISAGVRRQALRILNVALNHACRYGYLEENPVRGIITKFSGKSDVPPPYTPAQMRVLLGRTLGTKWEMAVFLAGMYGLRISEVLGLRWRNVDLARGVFQVCEQLPFHLAPGVLRVGEMAPVKSESRELPITAQAAPYFARQLGLRERDRAERVLRGEPYYENDLVVARGDGSPYRQEVVSSEFRVLLRALDMPHIRFHDLRHTAATNIYQFTGDFFAVSFILGHSMNGTGISLEQGRKIESTTALYVDVRLDRKREVLKVYHDQVLPPEPESPETQGE